MAVSLATPAPPTRGRRRLLRAMFLPGRKVHADEKRRPGREPGCGLLMTDGAHSSRIVVPLYYAPGSDGAPVKLAAALVQPGHCSTHPSQKKTAFGCLPLCGLWMHLVGCIEKEKKNLDILGDNVQQNEFAMGLIDTGEICCRPPPRNQLGVSAVLGALLQLLCNKEERSRPPCQRGGNVPAPETGLGGPSALGTENC